MPEAPPTDKDLLALLRGDLSGDEEARLEAALSESPELQSRLEALSGANDFTTHFHAEEGRGGSHTPSPSSLSHLPSSGKPPSRLGSYEILSHIATGGMGLVYRARDPDLKRTVALKLLAPALAANADARERFLREASSAAAIEHPNIVPIYAIDKDSAAQPFLVMRFIEGGTLQDYLDHLPEGATVPDDFIITIATAVARALSAAHGDPRAGGPSTAGAASHSSGTLVHRDIKPSNILLEGDTAPLLGGAGGGSKSSVPHPASAIYLTDFGLARTLEDSDILTSPDTFLGTPRFTSPEQAEGHPKIDHRADLFSLGTVLYTLATGKTPFLGDSPTTTIYQVVHKAHQPIEELAPQRPAWLAALIDRLLEKDPADRYQSAGDVLDCLEHQTSDPPSTSSASKKRLPVKALLAVAAAVVLAGFILPQLGGQGSRPAAVASDDTPFSISHTAAPYASLPDAIAAARPGDTITIAARPDGQAIPLPPLVTPEGKALTITGADPAQPPLLAQSDASQPLLLNRAPLTLEHLVITRTPEAAATADPVINCIAAERAALTIRHCRFHLVTPEISRRERTQENTGAAIRILGPTPFEMSHSQLYVAGQRGLRIDLDQSDQPSTVRLEHNIVSAGTGLGIVGGLPGGPETLITLRNNTFVCNTIISFFLAGESSPLRFDTARNLFQGAQTIISTHRAVALVRDHVQWREEDNLILTSGFLLRAISAKNHRIMGVESIAQWNELWSITSTSRTGTIHKRITPLAEHYRLLDTDLSQITPADFALTPADLGPLTGIGPDL